MSNEKLTADSPSISNRTRDGATVEPPAGDGEPGAATDLRYCRKCEVEVVPEGKGKCPRCGGFLRLNFVARRHKVNVLRRDALLAELVAEFRPGNILERSACEHLSAVLEQLDSMRPGTTEWQRLVTTAQTLGTALRSTQPEARTSTDYSAHSEDELIVKLETLLDEARAMRDFKRDSKRDAAEQPVDKEDEGYLLPEPGDADDSVPSAPPVDTKCPYCNQTPCVGPDHPAFRTLHGNDPAEVKRRDAEATREMFAQVGKPPSPYL